MHNIKNTKTVFPSILHFRSYQRGTDEFIFHHAPLIRGLLNDVEALVGKLPLKMTLLAFNFARGGSVSNRSTVHKQLFFPNKVLENHGLDVHFCFILPLSRIESLEQQLSSISSSSGSSDVTEIISYANQVRHKSPTELVAAIDKLLPSARQLLTAQHEAATLEAVDDASVQQIIQSCVTVDGGNLTIDWTMEGRMKSLFSRSKYPLSLIHEGLDTLYRLFGATVPQSFDFLGEIKEFGADKIKQLGATLIMGHFHTLRQEKTVTTETNQSLKSQGEYLIHTLQSLTPDNSDYLGVFAQCDPADKLQIMCLGLSFLLQRKATLPDYVFGKAAAIYSKGRAQTEALSTTPFDNLMSVALQYAYTRQAFGLANSTTMKVTKI